MDKTGSVRVRQSRVVVAMRETAITGAERFAALAA